MMERFQDAEFSWHCCPQKTVTIRRSVCVHSPNPRLSVLFTDPTPVSPCLAQRGSDMRGSTVTSILHYQTSQNSEISIQVVDMLSQICKACNATLLPILTPSICQVDLLGLLSESFQGYKLFSLRLLVRKTDFYESGHGHD